MTADEPTFETLFGSAERSAVHLEMRDGYMRSDPMFTAWQAGHRDDPADRASWWSPWSELVAQTVGRGVDVKRARIVSEPVSEYIQFEYDLTFTNLAAGERVRWLPRRQATDLMLPGNDFWLFDDRRVLVNHFTGEGEAVNLELVTDPSMAAKCASAFEQVWQRATPHEHYRPE